MWGDICCSDRFWPLDLSPVAGVQDIFPLILHYFGDLVEWCCFSTPHDDCDKFQCNSAAPVYQTKMNDYKIKKEISLNLSTIEWVAVIKRKPTWWIQWRNWWLIPWFNSIEFNLFYLTLVVKWPNYRKYYNLKLILKHIKWHQNDL